MITVLVVDDEPLARRKLGALIAGTPWLTQIGEAGDGAGALEAISRLQPDIVLLDIQMPGLSGVEVVTRLQRAASAPAVVFTTAHAQYAVTAFELAAIDYLIKPFGRKRFLTAMERARNALEPRAAAAALARADDALGGTSPGAPLDRLFVRTGAGILPLPVSGIERIEAQDDYVSVHAEGRHHLVSLRIAALEARLPNPPFLRVHRSHIVNMDFVERLIALEGARLEAVMKRGERVPVSRVRAQALRRLAR